MLFTKEYSDNELQGNAASEKFQGHGAQRESLGWQEENFLQ